MVDVSAKPATEREALAEGRVLMQPATLAIVRKGDAKKGDVLGAARIAGIMAAKRTHELDPALPSARHLEGRGRSHARRQAAGHSTCGRESRSRDKTGVEMEALTAVAVACLTVYDMVKAVERGMRIEGIRLVEKRGGRSGHYRAKE